MKEAAMDVAAQGKRMGTVAAVRSESEKEKTKMRERQRRAITTKIFHGLRKHGGYRLSPRADINEVLRELAKEAGWIIEPDGTTYRSPKSWNCCLVCGVARTNATPTPTSSAVVIGGGGECSTTASPRRFSVGDSMINVGGPTSLNNFSAFAQELISDRDIPLAVYMYGGLSGSFPPSDAVAAVSGVGGAASAAGIMGYQQQMYMLEARASNHNTPVGSPLHRA